MPLCEETLVERTNDFVTTDTDTHEGEKKGSNKGAVFGHENMSELDLGASKVVLVVVDGGSDKEKEKKKEKKGAHDITMKIKTLVDRCDRVAQAH